jgi:hypothetical protein
MYKDKDISLIADEWVIEWWLQYHSDAIISRSSEL